MLLSKAGPRNNLVSKRSTARKKLPTAGLHGFVIKILTDEDSTNSDLALRRYSQTQFVGRFAKLLSSLFVVEFMCIDAYSSRMSLFQVTQLHTQAKSNKIIEQHITARNNALYVI